jgi:hypothetical protein
LMEYALGPIEVNPGLNTAKSLKTGWA